MINCFVLSPQICFFFDGFAFAQFNQKVVLSFRGVTIKLCVWMCVEWNRSISLSLKSLCRLAYHYIFSYSHYQLKITSKIPLSAYNCLTILEEFRCFGYVLSPVSDVRFLDTGTATEVDFYWQLGKIHPFHCRWWWSLSQRWRTVIKTGWSRLTGNARPQQVPNMRLTGVCCTSTYVCFLVGRSNVSSNVVSRSFFLSWCFSFFLLWLVEVSVSCFAKSWSMVS